VKLGVLFRDDDVVPVEHTATGIGIPLCLPGKTPRQTQIYLELAGGPFLASFDAGLDEMRDIAPREEPRLRIVQISWRQPCQ